MSLAGSCFSTESAHRPSLVKALIEAGADGEICLELLEEFVVGLAVQLCLNSQKIEKLKKETAGMGSVPMPLSTARGRSNVGWCPCAASS